MRFKAHGRRGQRNKRLQSCLCESDKARRSKISLNYGSYIRRVLHQIYPEYAITSKSVAVVDSLANDVFHRFAEEASWLNRHRKRKTITSKEIKSAAQLLLPEDLAKYAIHDGNKALRLYSERY